MKFFREMAPWLVALALLLCAVPAFAAEAPDSADAYAPEAGEVLNDDSGPSAPADDSPAPEPPASSGDDSVPEPPDSSGGNSVPDSPGSDGNDLIPDSPGSDGDGSDPDSTDSSDGDSSSADEPTSGTGGGGGGSGPALGLPSSVTCSGSEVTVNLDDRAYTSVANVDNGAVFGVDGIPAEYSSGSLTLSGFLRAMFGEYTPKTQTVVTYFDGQALDVSTEYVPGIAGMDMEWIASVVLFGLVIYCLFRLLGGMVR